MHIDAYEKLWMYVAGAIVLVMLGSIFYVAFAHSVHDNSSS